MDNPPDFETILACLRKRGVRFVVVGGLAGIYHGAANITEDVDIVYARDDQNLKRLSAVLLELHAYPRKAPPGLPFTPDEATLRMGLNFTFDTDAAPLDTLGEIDGVGDYERAAQDAAEGSFEGVAIPFLSLDKLIAAKRAAGRPKDLVMLDSLIVIKKARQGLEKP